MLIKPTIGNMKFSAVFSLERDEASAAKMKLLIVFVAGLFLGSVTAVHQLGFMPKLGFEICAQDPAKNVIASPASVYTALGLAYLGAAGNTATEMQNVLNFEGKTKEEVAQSFADFMKKFEGRREETKFHIANRIFVHEKYELSPKFNELAAKYLNSAAEKVNFAKPAQTAAKINSWVAGNTNQKIKNIVEADNIDASQLVVLVNAIYFKAHWEHPFEVENTTKKDFFVSENEKTAVDMMYKEGFFNYAEWEELDAKAIQLPFVNTDIYMLIALPNQVDGLEALQQKFQSANLEELRAKIHRRKVQLSLPKFKFEYSISLNETLKQMGLESMFESPDFSGLLVNDKSVPLTDVIHKAFIAVDEIGTEASAATLIEMSRMGRFNPPQAEVYDFKADHPFMFAIKNRDTIYFSGHVRRF